MMYSTPSARMLSSTSFLAFLRPHACPSLSAIKFAAVDRRGNRPADRRMVCMLQPYQCGGSRPKSAATAASVSFSVQIGSSLSGSVPQVPNRRRGFASRWRVGSCVESTSWEGGGATSITISVGPSLSAFPAD